MHPHTPLSVSVAVAAALLAGCGPDDTATSSTPPTTTSAPSQAPAPAPVQTPTPKPASLADLPAAAIVARAEAALHKTRAFRVDGTDRSDGQTATIDMRFGEAGSHGSITIDGAAIRLIVIGKTAYMRLSDKAWRSELPKQEADAVIELLGGRWLKAPTTHPDFKDIADFGDKTAMVRSLFAEAGPTFRKTGPKTIDGVRCIGIDDHDGLLWVNAATAQPVRMDSSKGSSGSMRFSEVGTAPDPKAPPAAQVVDIRSLQ